MNRVKKIRNYITSSFAEVGKLTWPSKDEIKQLTRLVLVGAVLLSIYIALFDSIFEQGLEWLLNRNG